MFCHSRLYSFVFHPNSQLFERRNGLVFFIRLCRIFLEQSLINTPIQEIGDHHCFYIYGLLHLFMERVFPVDASEASLSAIF
jgi:hypothetical protein